MKKLFAEYYELTEKRINEIWDNSLIVFDTNVLLNLYRYNDAARDEFIKVIKFYKERLWIPYQVGLEFHRRREDIMRKNATAYKSLREKLSEQLVKTVSSFEGEYARHPYINMKDIKKKVERCADSIAKSLEKQEKEHPDYFQDDDTLKSITELFDGRVGNDFKENDLETLYKEGEKRYANKIPPGYCDEKNKKEKGKRSLYGDLIVWKQTIHYCKEQAKSVIFITDDHKPDWWDNVEGKHSPRKELIKEFADKTGQSILIYDSRRFLEYAKRNKELKVSQKTINEVEKVSDENKYWSFNNLYKIPSLQEAMESISTISSMQESLKSISDNINKTVYGSIPQMVDWTKYNYLDNLHESMDAIKMMDSINIKTQNVNVLRRPQTKNLSNELDKLDCDKTSE